MIEHLLRMAKRKAVLLQPYEALFVTTSGSLTKAMLSKGPPYSLLIAKHHGYNLNWDSISDDLHSFLGGQ